MRVYREGGHRGKASCVSNLGTRWRLIVNFSLWPILPMGKRVPGIHRIGVWVSYDGSLVEICVYYIVFQK
jgi:hypothetical protein